MATINPNKAFVKVVYQGKDITVNLQPYLISFTYKDKAIGEADELSLVMRDDANLWKGPWNPVKGDTIVGSIVQPGSGELPCGTFTVDDLDFAGGREGGHTVSINALAAGVKDAVRTRSSFAHEGKTLQAIAQKIADKYGYTVQGIIHNFSIARVTQWHETDLGFLQRIAEEFGYFFSLKGTTLVFTYLPEMSAAAGNITVNMNDCMTYRIKDKVAGIYVKGHNRYHNHKLKQVYDSLVAAGANPSADSYETRRKVDNDEQGLYKVDGRLYKKNMEQVELDVTIPGNIYLLSGNNVTSAGFYNYNSVYMISQSTHIVTKDGSYVTNPILKKILPNAATGSPAGTATGYDKAVDISTEAKIIYNNLQTLITAGSTNTLTPAIAQSCNSNINSAIQSIRLKGDGDVADDIATQYGNISTEYFTTPAQAQSDAQALQQVVLPYETPPQ